MENQAVMETTARLNDDFLEAVESSIAAALRAVSDLEASFEDVAPAAKSNWQEAFTDMSVNLSNWQDRLGELSKQTAVVEAELTEHEHALRGWFQAAGLTSNRLAEASKPR